MANVYTIWLLRWGYEIVTLSISSLILGLTIFVLEVYEFILHKRAEPEYLGVGSYFKGQGAANNLRKKQMASSARKKSQVRVMSIMDDGIVAAAGINHTEEDDSNVILQ